MHPACRTLCATDSLSLARSHAHCTCLTIRRLLFLSCKIHKSSRLLTTTHLGVLGTPFLPGQGCSAGAEGGSIPSPGVVVYILLLYVEYYIVSNPDVNIFILRFLVCCFRKGTIQMFLFRESTRNVLFFRLHFRRKSWHSLIPFALVSITLLLELLIRGWSSCSHSPEG